MNNNHRKMHFYLIKPFSRVPAPSAPTSVQASPSGPTELLVTWEQPSEINGVLIQFIITWTTDDGSTNMSVAGANLSVTLTDLEPCQTYSITIAGVTGGGTGPESDPETAETGVAREEHGHIKEHLIIFIALIHLCLIFCNLYILFHLHTSKEKISFQRKYKDYFFLSCDRSSQSDEPHKPILRRSVHQPAVAAT